MSSLLEQAIIDAAALKEAAIKNAETAILNKYSADIKEVVENLFDQDEETEVVSDTIEEPEISTPLEDSIPLGLAPEGADSEAEIVLNMEELKEMAEVLSAQDEDLMGDPTPHKDLVDSDEMTPQSPAATDAEVDTVSVQAALEEEIDISDIDELLEELVVDIDPQKSGWAGTPNDIMHYKEQLKLAQLSATKAEEENKELVAARDRLSEENKKLRDGVRVLKEKFNQSSLSNAKLLYTNRVLTNTSLNERQKIRIVEALSKADSINDAKVIFETLKSAVGSVQGKTRPQSLRETVEKPTATLPRREAKSDNLPFTSRMQLLAGIKK